MPDDLGVTEWWETVRGAASVAAAMTALLAACIVLAVTVGDGYHLAATAACAVGWVLAVANARDAWRGRHTATQPRTTVHL